MQWYLEAVVPPPHSCWGDGRQLRGRGPPELSGRGLDWFFSPFLMELIQSGWFAVGGKPSPETEDAELVIKTSSKICYVFFPPPDLPLKMICREDENMGKQTWLKFPHIKYLCGNGRREQGPLEKLWFISEESGGMSSWQRKNENPVLCLCDLGRILAFYFHLLEFISLWLCSTYTEGVWSTVGEHRSIVLSAGAWGR